MACTRIQLDTGISLVVARPHGAPTRRVLLLHGIGGNARSCSEAAELLSGQGIEAYAWDAPGYGESADPSGPVDHPGEVLAAVDELGLDQVDLFGTSWGGVIATQVAARAPERVRSLVLADSTRGSATSPEQAAGMAARVTALTELGAAEFAATRAPRLVSASAPASVGQQVREVMATVRPPGYRSAAEFMARTDNTALLRELRTPTLVVVGADDVVTGVAESRLLAELVPGASFEVIPEAGHSAVTERPEELVRVLTAFWGVLDD
ncbi:alpha/beta hydrolase [Enemella evansiae]|uniref:alpha/beta fold hydrolase n=1 Tax=Enemella evansiae TaxID=2016499 RepID=UPI000B97162B|nr:alpha/beta fold hydrolase [Enemella evansiae]OYN95314.1 alpha/beta hydrolase [Enemella evansiae]